MSLFGKICIEGLDVELFFNYVCGVDMSVLVGWIVYMQMFNIVGGIEVDVIVIWISEMVYLMVIFVVICLVDQIWLCCYFGDYQVVLMDVISGEVVLVVMGFIFCDLFGWVLLNDFINDVNFFGIVQEIEIGMVFVCVY